MAVSSYIYPGGSNCPMIVQNTRQLFKKRFPSVIRCIAEGRMAGKDFIAIGCQDKKLHILDSNLNEIQAIEFQQWVRCIAIENITKDENGAILVGIGDSTMRLFRFTGKQYEESHVFNFNNFVNGCALIDVDGDGKPEIIGGSWDKTLKIFDSETYAVKWEEEFPQEIDLIKCADFNYDGRIEIGIAFRGGTFVVLEGKKGLPLWEYDCEKDIIACDVGYFDFSGYPYIVLGGNDQYLHFIDIKGQRIHKISTGDRITALGIGDIDDDDRNEILVGSGNDRLLCYDLKSNDLYSIDLKWKLHINGVVNTFLINDINADQKSEVLIGGYDTFLTGLQDNYIGIKPKVCLPVMPLFVCPKARLAPPQVVVPAAISVKTGTPLAQSVTPIAVNQPASSLFHDDNESRQIRPNESRVQQIEA